MLTGNGRSRSGQRFVEAPKAEGKIAAPMSAIGTKRTFCTAQTMSAFGGKADIYRQLGLHQVVSPELGVEATRERRTMRVWVWTVALCFMASVAQAQNSLPIIDMHLHGGYAIGFRAGPDGTPARRPCSPAPCDPGPAEISSREEIIPKTLEYMRKHNVVLGVVSDQPPFPVDEEWVFDDWSAQDPERFIFGYHIWSPSDIAVEDLRQLLNEGRIQVIGELGFQYRNIPIDDPSLEPFFLLAEEMDIPVQLHHGALGAGLAFPMQLGDPLRLATVLQKHPTLRIYVENASYPFLQEIVAVMTKYPNVYVDLSTTLSSLPRSAIHAHLRGLVERGLSKRIMFGSDQMQWPETIEIAIETIESAEFLTEEDKRDIFYNNAARFLRLSDEQIAAHHAN